MSEMPTCERCVRQHEPWEPPVALGPLLSETEVIARQDGKFVGCKGWLYHDEARGGLAAICAFCITPAELATAWEQVEAAGEERDDA